MEALCVPPLDKNRNALFTHIKFSEREKMASPLASHPVRVDVSRVVELPTVLRLMYASFAAGGCLGLWGGVLGCSDFLCQDQPEKRRRARQFGALVTILCGISAGTILVLTAPSSKSKA